MPRKKKGELPSSHIRRQVYVGLREDGSRRYESFTARTSVEAERMASEYRVMVKAMLAQGVKVEDIPSTVGGEPPNKKKGITLGEALDQYIDTCRHQGYSPSTIPSYVSIQKNHFRSLQEKEISAITISEIQAEVNLLSENHSPKTVRNAFFLIQAVLKSHAPNLNLSSITLQKRKKRKKIVFKESWAFDILRHLRKRPSPDLYIYASFIISAGLRPSEIYALEWEDLSESPVSLIHNGQIYQIGYIHVDKDSVRDEFGKYTMKGTKTDAGVRDISVDWSFFEDLYALKKRASGQIVIMKPNSVTKFWTKVRAELGLPEDFRFYDLRHYYATSVATSGATEDELKARMGHSTSGFSHDVYVELFEGRQEVINANMSSATSALYSSLRPN